MTARTRTRPRRLGRGFTFIEIMFATAILAFAMIPVFGLMTSGLMRTDVNVGHSNAVEIATGLMNQILSEETSMASLAFTSGTASFPERGSPLAAGTGSVAHLSSMDHLFQSGAWTTVTTAETRMIRTNGIEYQVQIWLRGYQAANDLRFGFFEVPVIEYRAFPDDPPSKLTSEFDRVRTLDEATHQDFSRGYSPFSPQNVQDHASEPTSRVSTFPFAQVTVLEDQSTISEPDPATGNFRDFAKVWIRVSWGYEGRRERGRAKDFWLISFKADLQE